jgi:hypothetical protein
MTTRGDRAPQAPRARRLRLGTPTASASSRDLSRPVNGDGLVTVVAALSITSRRTIAASGGCANRSRTALRSPLAALD